MRRNYGCPYRKVGRAERASQTLLDNLARTWMDLPQGELVARVTRAFERYGRAVCRDLRRRVP